MPSVPARMVSELYKLQGKWLMYDEEFDSFAPNRVIL